MNPEFRKSVKGANPFVDDGRFALGLLLGLCLALFLWLLNGGTIAESDAKTLVPALATALVALASLVVSLVALSEQKRMRQAGTDPVLVAHIGQRKDEPFVLVLFVSNVGAGAAMNVRVRADKPSNLNQKDLLGNPFDTDVLCGRLPVRVILQNEKITYPIGVGHELVADPVLAKFLVALDYQDVEGNSYSSTHEIDVAELKDRPADSPASTKIWRELEKIQKKIK